MAKIRLDRILVERGLAASREKAQALIMAGHVVVSDRPAVKPGHPVDKDAPIIVKGNPPYVSRGGIKLAHALAQFRIDVSGKIALDVGASTGGFTDCLLKHGAAKVYAVDVGYGQLDQRLRSDPRVVVMERVNAHYSFSLPEKADLATVDVSFISLTKVLPSVTEHLRPGGYVVALLKPQFEAERREVGKGGVIKDTAIHARVLGRAILWVIEHRIRLRGLIPSPILGDKGNREFFLLLEPLPTND
ncbi:MAG: TlyA family RNA methyltransferase [Chloroflexi bacterium]|nr:TlyA family RNA methyltransferase [Chloroflexota bacterium]